MLTGNDIGPNSWALASTDIFLLLLGALMNANIFGTIASIF